VEAEEGVAVPPTVTTPAAEPPGRPSRITRTTAPAVQPEPAEVEPEPKIVPEVPIWRRPIAVGVAGGAILLVLIAVVVRLLTSSHVPALVLTAAALPGVRVGDAYSASLSATGGSAPYRWEVSGSRLPGGLSLNESDGSIAGTPSADGSFSFSARVRDSKGKAAVRGFTIAIQPKPADTTPNPPPPPPPPPELTLRT